MDSYSGRENMLVGLASQRSLSNKKKVIDTSDSEMDFNDVFGGPPRRASSIHEMRHSFSESKQYRRRRVDEEEGVKREVPRSPWFVYEEKPVFGQEGSGMVMRKKTSDDFYDDIFRGDESPKVANSLPGSRVLSPARPSTLKDDSFASSSLPAFSLPEKLNRGLDLPALASISRSLNRKVDVASNGMSLPNSSSPPSRFSSPPTLVNDESRSKIQQPYRQSPLSVEFSLGREVNQSDKVDGNDDEKKLSRSPNSLGNSNNFHFSIYKWASKGPSVMVPLRTRNDSKVRDDNEEKYLSSGGSIKTDIIVTELPADILSDTLAGDDKYISVQIKKQENGSVNEIRQGTLNVNQCQSEGESTPSVHELESTIKDVSSGMPLSGKSVSKKAENKILSSRNEPQKPASKPQSVPEIGVVKKIDDSSVTTKAANKSEKKSLRSWISDRQGDDVKLGDKVKDGNSKSKSSSVSIKADKNTKKRDGKSSTSKDVATDKASSKGSSVTVGDRGGKNKVKGKVKDFVKIFNQEVPSKSGTGIETQSQKSRRKSIDTSKVENEEHPNIYKAVDFSTPEVEQIISNIFPQEGFSESSEQKSGTETRIPTHSDTSPKQTESQSSESYPGGFKDTAAGAFDDCFEGEFQVKELSDLNDYTSPQNGGVQEDFKADDSKIRKWSNGKDTNIRSLLTTLQYVLWPESGWKPIALVDIIEANSVRRAYQKALLCLHPDKLQQKGASPRQKYIAEKVFDILQEAWAHFNSLGSV